MKVYAPQEFNFELDHEEKNILYKASMLLQSIGDIMERYECDALACDYGEKESIFLLTQLDIMSKELMSLTEYETCKIF